MSEGAHSRLTVKLCLNVVERLPHHELETIIRHDLCFAWVIVDSHWVIGHCFWIFRRSQYALNSARRDIKLGQNVTAIDQMI